MFCCHLVAEQTASEYYEAAMKAYKEKDYKSFVGNLHKVVESGTTHPRVYYNLACGYALLNNTSEAIRWLDRVAGLGIAYPIQEDEDLKSIHETPEFKAIAGKFERNNRPVVHSKQAFTLPEDFIPEGVAYDPVSDRFYTGSILQKKIVEVDPQGNLSDVSSGEDGLYEVLGMSIDHSRNMLWVSSSKFIDVDSEARKVSAILCYDLKEKKLIKKYDLSADQPHQLGDVIVNSAGDAFATDSLNPAIFWIDHQTDKLQQFPVEDLFRSPQGLCFSPDEQLLFVADYVHGIFAIDLKTNKHWNLAEPANATLAGIDGLYQYKGSLIATQNGFTPNRVLRIEINDAKDQAVRVKILEAGDPKKGEFTLGTIVGDDFYYVANSQLSIYLEDHKARLSPTMIRKLGL